MRALATAMMFVFSLGLTVQLIAADEPQKGKGKGKGKGTPPSLSEQMLKQLEPAKLTEEQTAKVKELAAKAQSESDKVKADAKIDAKVLQARNTAMKEARDAKKSPKEVRDAGEAALAGLSAEQKAALKSSDEILTKFRKQVYELLSDTQRTALPEQVRTNLERSANGGKKKA